jgi:hypothetical protein
MHFGIARLVGILVDDGALMIPAAVPPSYRRVRRAEFCTRGELFWGREHPPDMREGARRQGLVPNRRG